MTESVETYSALVTLAAPAPVVEILFDRASITACKPVADPPPAEVQETFDTADWRVDTVFDKAECAWLRALTCWLMTLILSDRTLSADCRLLISLLSALLTIEAALLAAFATLNALLAAVETIDTALLTTLIACDRKSFCAGIGQTSKRTSSKAMPTRALPTAFVGATESLPDVEPK